IGVTTGYAWLIERAERQPPAKRAQPSPDLLRRWAAALAWDVARQRLIFELAGHPTSRVPPAGPLPQLAAGGFSSPRILDLELRALFDDVQNLITDPELSATQRSEALRLLNSFVSWLTVATRGEDGR